MIASQCGGETLVAIFHTVPSGTFYFDTSIFFFHNVHCSIMSYTIELLYTLLLCSTA